MLGSSFPSAPSIGRLENTTSGSVYRLVAKKGEGAFSTVFAAVCEAAPDGGVHARKMHPMSPPALAAGAPVAVKRISLGGGARRPNNSSNSNSNSNYSNSNSTNFLDFNGASTRRFDASPSADDVGLAECDLLRRLTWTTNVFVPGCDPAAAAPAQAAPPKPAAAAAAARLDADALPLTLTQDLDRDVGAGGGVVKLFEVIENEDSLFFVMEYCGMDLFHCITSRHGLPNTVIKDLFTQISNAVYFCHQNGVYHRDLKPENILIDTSNLSIRLADFGLATDQEWSDNMGCGSVRYMSPECLGIPIDTISMNPPANIRPGYSPLKNDVWSLGVILINLVFSRNPWHSVKDAFCCTKYLFLQQPALKDEFNLSDEFDAILRRCFDPNPETRCGVLEFRDLVWHCSSFTKDGPIEQEDALPAVPPPPPQQGGNVKFVYLGYSVGAESDTASTANSNFYGSSHPPESISEGSQTSVPRAAPRAHHSKKLPSVTILQKMLSELDVGDRRRTNTPVALPSHALTRGVEMKFGDSSLSNLSTSSGGSVELESSHNNNKVPMGHNESAASHSGYDQQNQSRAVGNSGARLETRPWTGARERSSSLSNSVAPNMDQILNSRPGQYYSPSSTPVPHIRERAESLSKHNNTQSHYNTDYDPRGEPSQQTFHTHFQYPHQVPPQQQQQLPPQTRSLSYTKNLSRSALSIASSVVNHSEPAHNPLFSPHLQEQQQPRMHSAPNAATTPIVPISPISISTRTLPLLPIGRARLASNDQQMMSSHHYNTPPPPSSPTTVPNSIYSFDEHAIPFQQQQQPHSPHHQRAPSNHRLSLSVTSSNNSNHSSSSNSREDSTSTTTTTTTTSSSNLGGPQPHQRLRRSSAMPPMMQPVQIHSQTAAAAAAASGHVSTNSLRSVLGTPPSSSSSSSSSSTSPVVGRSMMGKLYQHNHHHQPNRSSSLSAIEDDFEAQVIASYGGAAGVNSINSLDRVSSSTSDEQSGGSAAAAATADHGLPRMKPGVVGVVVDYDDESTTEYSGGPGAFGGIQSASKLKLRNKRLSIESGGGGGGVGRMSLDSVEYVGGPGVFKT